MTATFRMSPRASIFLIAIASAAFLFAASASAATSAPGWAIHSFANPTNFSPAGCVQAGTDSLEESYCDAYRITATDAGSAATDGSAVTLADTLPAGLEANRIRLFWSGFPAAQGGPQSDLAEKFGLCSQTPPRCTIPASFFAAHGGPVRPDDTLKMIVFLSVTDASERLLSNSATIEGGGAPKAEVSSENQLASAPAPFGVVGLLDRIAGPDGQVETQAGGHPYQLSTRIDFANAFKIDPAARFGLSSVEDPRDILVDLPLGFLGTALAAPTCKFSELSSHSAGGISGCPTDTIVGHLLTEPLSSTSVEGPIYNMTPEQGVAAEFGYIDQLAGAHVLYASVVPTPSGYVLRTTGPEIPQVPLTDIVTTFFGDPTAHNASREPQEGDVPFFTNPAECSGEALRTHIYTDSWQHPGTYNPDGSPNLTDPAWAQATSDSEAVSGCNQLQFKPTIEAKPETDRADSPTGLDVTLKVPQSEDVTTLGIPPLRKAVVTLPAGMSVNPSSANGLSGCSLAELGMSPSGEPNAAAPHCPNSAKIGTVALKTPALPGTLSGQIYVAKQTENPFKSLIAIYIVVDDPSTGVIVKLPGEVRADPSTGQLSTVVDNSPQFPFSELTTHFFGGTKAALRTPATCGTYKVTSVLTPYSAPQSGLPATPSASFKTSAGAGPAPCPTQPAKEPNNPSFHAGTLTPLAGAFSPFGLELHREDGSQELKGLNVTLPPGLIGKLAGLSECPEAALAQARSREHEGLGSLELANPSCPPSSEVGSVTVAAGAGLTPYYATGHAYLAGPYKGAPLSLAVITPAVAGPFDLGNVLVRNALQVNPDTAQITAISDPIPHILHGIPLDVRSIALNLTRNQFTLNPTNCERKEVKGEALSIFNQIAPLTNPFQVGGCKALGFHPELKLSLKGSTKRTGHPALKAVLTYPKKGAYANIAKAAVTLPHSAFLEQAHIKTICTRVQFAEGAVPGEKCPPGSIYGYAKATTPLLDNPVQGPVYLRSSSNKLPDLVAALNGQINVVLDGRIDTGKSGGIRNTFDVVPDAPVTKFTLEMKGGAKGLLVNSENLCSPKAKTHAVAKFTAQNGKVDNYNPAVANSCKKHGKGHGHHKGKH